MKAGTLKFIINASIETLPTPANLRRWLYSSSNICTHNPNNLVNYIVTNVDKKFTVYSDVPGMEALGGGTIPPALCVTKNKPDFVIMDNHMKALHIFELTMPLSRNNDARHKEKTDNYAPFLRDIAGYSCSLNCFEVTSTGYVRTHIQKTLSILHKFLNNDLKRSVFLNNLNSLAWYGSYQVWFSSQDPNFASTSYIIPDLQ